MTTGIGLAIHETDKPHRNGILIDQIGEAYTGIPSGIGEMLAIYRALEICNERGYKTIKIKTDYNYLKKLLKTNYKQQTGKDRDDIVGAILSLSDLFDIVTFQYKPKRKNQMSHKLARTAIYNCMPILRRDLIELSKLKLPENNPCRAKCNMSGCKAGHCHRRLHHLYKNDAMPHMCNAYY